jgi:uncharacterized membrane protein YeaQ/YmgE (transglycosylase-associated protein family)
VASASPGGSLAYRQLAHLAQLAQHVHYLSAKGERTMNLEPGGLLAWLLVGLIAGWLAGQVMRGSGYGLVGDIVVGIVGAFLGGFLASLLGITGTAGLVGSIVVAFIGAIVLIAILRAVSGARSPA